VTERVGQFVLNGVQGGASGVVDRYKARQATRAETAAQADKAVPVVKTKKTKKTKRKAKKQQRVEPTFSTQPPAPTSGRAGAKRGKRSGKAAQLPLPIDDEQAVDIPSYDPAKDSPIPPTALLDPARESSGDGAEDESKLQQMSADLEQHLADFNVQAKVVAVHPGPVVTRFEVD